MMKYKIGDVVKVKEGTPDPDFEDLDISNWQGEIIEDDEDELDEDEFDEDELDEDEFDEDELDEDELDEDELDEDELDDDEVVYLIKWDNTTLNQMSDEYLERAELEGLRASEMYLGESDIEFAEPRPDEDLVERNIVVLDEEEKRIAEILGDTDIYYSDEKLEKYRKFLEANLNPNLLLTGREDFSWEERFLFGYGDKYEYKEMKKTRPSYKDLFRFMAIEDEIDDRWKLVAKVKRLSDRKFFSIPLCDLAPKDEECLDYNILKDYSSWITNWADY